MLAGGLSLDSVGKIIRNYERGFLTELEMETMVLSAVFDRIRVFISNNL